MLIRRLCIALAVCVSGCAIAPPQPQQLDPVVLSAAGSHTFLKLSAGHTYRDALAHAGDGVGLTDLNMINGPRVDGAQVVAVPQATQNPSGFFPDGFRLIPILCYHQFTQADEVSQRLEVTAAAFRAQLQYLKDNKFQVLSLAQVEHILEQRQPLPERAVALTIDDGYRSVYDVALPIIQEFGFPFTLYVYTDFVGGGAALTWAQIKELQASGLVDVQSHGKSHTSLSRLEQDSSVSAYHERVRAELVESQRVLERRLGHRAWQISYPYGNTSDALPELMTKAGYRLGLTVTRGDNTAYADPHFLHRTMIYGDHSLEDFIKLTRTFRGQQLR